MTASDGNGEVTIALGGRLAASDTSRVVDAFASAIQSGSRRIRVDVSALDYISSAGILAIEATAARVRSDGRSLEIAGAIGAVRIALELAGLK